MGDRVKLIVRTAVPFAMFVLGFLALGRSADYDRSTELLTLSIGAQLLMFFAGCLGAAMILWGTQRGLPPEEPQSGGSKPMWGCALVFIVMLWGMAATTRAADWAEARAFGGSDFALTQADYPIGGTNEGEPRGRAGLFGGSERYRPTITIVADGINGIIPAPLELVREAGHGRKDDPFNQKCLRLQIQQNGDAIRAVIRDVTGRWLEMQVLPCRARPSGV